MCAGTVKLNQSASSLLTCPHPAGAIWDLSIQAFTWEMLDLGLGLGKLLRKLSAKPLH